jgi:hypothetical protein
MAVARTRGARGPKVGAKYRPKSAADYFKRLRELPDDRYMSGGRVLPRFCPPSEKAFPQPSGRMTDAFLARLTDAARRLKEGEPEAEIAREHGAIVVREAKAGLRVSQSTLAGD